MTITEFAEKVGVDKSVVSRAIKNGRIKKNAEGGLDESEIESWHNNKSIENSPIQKSEQEKKYSRLFEKLGLNEGDFDNLPTYVDMKTVREFILTQRDKLDLDKELGKVIPVEELHKQERELARLVKQEILNIPKRVVNVLDITPALRKQLESILISEINALASRIEELQGR